MRQIVYEGMRVEQEMNGSGLRVNGTSLDPAIRRAFQQSGVQSTISILLAQERSPAQVAEELIASTDRDCRNFVRKVTNWIQDNDLFVNLVIAALVQYYARPTEYRRTRTDDSAVSPLPATP